MFSKKARRNVTKSTSGWFSLGKGNGSNSETRAKAVVRDYHKTLKGKERTWRESEKLSVFSKKIRQRSRERR